MTDPTPAAVLYLRSSLVRDADHVGIESQEAALRDLAARSGWAVVAVYRDESLKGWQDERQRPGLAAALAYCREHRPSILAVFDLSRLARTLLLQERLWTELAGHGVKVVSYREPWTAEPLIRQVVGAVAEHDRRIKRAYVVAAHKVRTAQGRYLGRVSLGYVPGPDGRLVPEGGERQAVVEEIFRRFGDGEGAVAICRDLNARGVPRPAGGAYWEKSTLLKLLRNPAYRGVVRTRHGACPDAHPVFVPAGALAAVEARLARIAAGERAPRRKARPSWLEGHVVHSCGRRMYLHPGAWNRGPHFRCAGLVSSTGERCRAAGVQRSAAMVEREALAALVAAVDRAAARSRRDLLAEAKRRARAADPGTERARGALRARVDAARAKIERAASAMIQHGLSDAWFAAEKAAAEADAAEAAARLAELPPAPSDPADVLERHGRAGTLADLLRDPDARPERLAAILAEVGVAVVSGRATRIRPHPEWAEVLGED